MWCYGLAEFISETLFVLRLGLWLLGFGGREAADLRAYGARFDNDRSRV